MRPTAYLLNDPYAIHRCYWDEDWEPSPLRDTQWTDWDFALDRAFQVIEDYTDKANGQLIWLDQSPDVYWETRTQSSGYDAAVSRREKELSDANKELDPGDSLYAVPTFKDPDNPPSMLDWLRDLEENDGRNRPNGAPKGGRPPTPEEILAMESLDAEQG